MPHLQTSDQHKTIKPPPKFWKNMLDDFCEPNIIFKNKPTWLQPLALKYLWNLTTWQLNRCQKVYAANIFCFTDYVY